MIEFGYMIVERNRGAYSDDGTLNFDKWTSLSLWENINKKLYLSRKSAEEALQSLQSSPGLNNQNRYTEFKIIPLFIENPLNNDIEK